ELETYAPKYVLVLAGKGWYKPFTDYLGIEIESINKNKFAEGVGLSKDRTWVFAKHPQGKQEDCFVSEVDEAFKLYDSVDSIEEYAPE
ncbi:MAG: hypothetical protein WA982_10335, partial [Rubrobacteraceae bacterium]